MRLHLRSYTVVAGVALATVIVGGRHGLAADNGSVAGTVTATGLATNADMVVSLQAPNLTPKPPAAPVDMDQKGKTFVPRVLAVVTGTTVKFLNSDPFAHNVFSPEGKYDLGSWQQGQVKDHPFTKAGAYTQLCRIHPEMEAFIVVLDTPYFAKTDQKGSFQIANVPPGQYTLVVWSEKLKPLRQPVTVEAGKPATVHLTLSR
jgi:plastocyanin